MIFQHRTSRPLARVRLSAVAVGVLLALVVAVLLTVSFTVGDPGSAKPGPHRTVGTTEKPIALSAIVG